MDRAEKTQVARRLRVPDRHSTGAVPAPARRVVVGLLWALGALVLAWVAASCTLPPSPPGATGSIAGHVTYTNGNDAAGTLVEALSLDGQTVVASITADAWGNYALGGLPVGNYKVRFTPAINGLLQEYWDNAPALTGAKTVVVLHNLTRTADATLDLAAKAKGKVVNDSGGHGVVGVTVQALHTDGRVMMETTTGADGDWAFDHLTPATYRFRFGGTGPGQNQLDIEYWNGVDTLGAATDVAVTIHVVTDLGTVGLAQILDPACAPGPGADLQGCDFTNMSLMGADLNGANVTGATFDNASIAGADLNGIVGLTLPQLLATNNDWSGTDLRNTGVNLAGTVLDTRDLSGADLSGLDLTGVQFAVHGPIEPWGVYQSCAENQATLAGTKVTGADLTDVELGRDQLVSLDPDIRNTTISPRFGACDLGFGYAASLITMPDDLSGGGWQLTGAHLVGINLSNKQFDGLDLTGFDGDESYLDGSDFDGANLTNAQLGQLLSGSLVNANLTGASVKLGSTVSLTGATVQGATIEASGPQLLSANRDWTGLDAVAKGTTSMANTNFSGGGWTLVGARLRGYDMAGSTFTGVDLTGAALAQSSLANAVGLTKAQLLSTDPDWRNLRLTGTGVDLSGIDFEGNGALLTGVKLDGLNASGADMHGLDLTQAGFANTNLSAANLSGANLTQAGFSNSNLSGANLSGANLTAATLTGADLSGANLTGANLQAVDLRTNDLAGADLTGCNLASANLSGNDLSGTILTGCNVASATFANAIGLTGAQALSTQGDWGSTDFTATGLDLSGTDFVARGANLTLVKLGSPTTAGRINLTGANLAGLDVEQALFDRAILTGANLTNLRVFRASFLLASGLTRDQVLATDHNWAFTSFRSTGLNLSGVDFTTGGFDLTYSSLANINLSNANFAGMNLYSIDLTSTTVTGTIFTGTSLEHASGISTARFKLTNPNWTGTRFANASTNFTGFDFAGGGFQLTGAMLRAVNLTNAQFDGLDLTGTDLSQADLGGADLTGATITGASFADAEDLTPAQLYAAQTDWTGIKLNGEGLFRDTHLMGIDFAGHGVTITNANLSMLDLTGANFTGLDLTGVVFERSKLSAPVGLTTAQLATTSPRWGGVRFDGSGIDFSGFDFSGRTISEAWFSGLNLTGVDLSGFDLWNTRLNGANLTNANFLGVTGPPIGGSSAIYNNTTCPNGAVTGQPGVLTCVGRGFNT